MNISNDNYQTESAKTQLQRKVCITRFSSSSLKEFDSLGLQGGSNAASIWLSLIGGQWVELLKLELLLLDALKEVDLNGVVVVDEEPATSVDEEAWVVLGKVSIS